MKAISISKRNWNVRLTRRPVLVITPVEKIESWVEKPPWWRRVLRLLVRIVAFVLVAGPESENIRLNRKEISGALEKFMS